MDTFADGQDDGDKQELFSTWNHNYIQILRLTPHPALPTAKPGEVPCNCRLDAFRDSTCLKSFSRVLYVWHLSGLFDPHRAKTACALKERSKGIAAFLISHSELGISCYLETAKR